MLKRISLTSAFFSSIQSLSALKLTEFITRYNLISPKNRVLDLGSAPGGWSQVAAQYAQSNRQQTSVFGVDYQFMDPIDGVKFIYGDLVDEETIFSIQQTLNLKPVDIILSDLDFERDNDDLSYNQCKMMELNNLTMYVALKTLKIGGCVLLKSLNGLQKEKNERYLKLFFQDFIEIKHSLIESYDYDELFYLGRGFKLNDNLKKYKKFVDAMLKGNLDDLKDEDIPEEYMSIEEIDRERFKTLKTMSETQFPIPKKWIDQLKNNERYQNVDWDKYDLNIQKDDLDDEQIEDFIKLLNSRKKKYESLEEAEEAYKIFIEKWQQFRKKQQIKKDDALLEDEEILGDDHEYKEMKKLENEIKRLGALDEDNHIDQETFNYEIEKELEELKKIENDPTFVNKYNKQLFDDFLQRKYPNLNKKDAENQVNNEFDAEKKKIQQMMNQRSEIWAEQLADRAFKEYNSQNFKSKDTQSNKKYRR